MKTYSKITPEGARDLLFEECRARREVQEKLSRVFGLRGYREVITPGLEYFDVFNLPGTAIPQQEMYKCTDNHGRLIVFRPDSTLPIARMAASRLQGHRKPLRFFYSQTIYRNRPDLSGRSDESAQMGIELMGAGGLRADLEVIALAVEALSACAPDFRMEIGHARFFQVLADQLPLSAAAQEELRATIESKNYAALSELLDPLGDLPAAKAMAQLPRLFGGEEVFGKAYELFSENGALECLDYLHGLYEDLRQLGLEDRVIIDLGLVNQAEYYTGLIFRGYFDGIGEPVLSGGRYDNLLGEFGAPLSATGFAVNIDPAAQVVGEPAPQTPDILVFSDERHLPEAVNYIKSLTENGLVAENCVYDDFDAAADYARRRGIRQLHVVDDAIEAVDVETLRGEGAR